MRIGSKALDIYCLGDRNLLWGFLSLNATLLGGCYETADVLQKTSFNFEERCASISVAPAPENPNESATRRQSCRETSVVVILTTKQGNMENISKSQQRTSVDQTGRNVQSDPEPLSNQLKNIPDPDQESLRTTPPAEGSALRESDCWCGEAQCTRKEQHIQEIGNKLDDLLDGIWRPYGR